MYMSLSFNINDIYYLTLNFVTIIEIRLTCPEPPKQLSTMAIRRAFASLFTEHENITVIQI